MNLVRVQDWKRIGLAMVAGFASLSFFAVGPSASADDYSQMTLAEIRKQVTDLEQQQQDLAVQQATAQEKLNTAQSQLVSTRDQIVSEQAKVTALQNQVAQIALQQYQDRGMNATSRLITSTSSDDLLGYFSVLQQVTATANSLLTDLQLNQANLADLERSEQAAVESITAEKANLDALEAQTKEKSDEASAALQRMTALATAAKASASGINSVGNGVANPSVVVASPSGATISPVSSYSMTSPFGMRLHPIWGSYLFHDGMDMATACGTPVVAPANGFVVDYYWAGGYGNRMVVDHGIINGHHIVTSFNHLSASVAAATDEVTQGQTIARVGSTGDSTGCHLHYMVWSDGQMMDPAAFIP